MSQASEPMVTVPAAKAPLTYHANDIMFLKLVRFASDVNSPATSFHPQFTHQIFENEEIVGLPNPRLLLYFASHSLLAYINLEWDGPLPPGVDPNLIRERLYPWLSTARTSCLQDFITALDEPFQPVGDLIHSYRLPPSHTTSTPSPLDLASSNSSTAPGSSDLVYEIYTGNFEMPRVRAFHSRCQIFALLFIDGASLLHVEDQRWDLYFLFEKRTVGTDVRYSFCGYSSVYRFYAFPENERMRISQMVLLPPFQRGGHGQQLLQCIYRVAAARNVVDVTIEDASPNFTKMRDLTDCLLCVQHGFFNIRGLPVPLDPPLINRIRSVLKLHKRQVVRCGEICNLACVNVNDAEAYRAYRLSIKRRLFSAMKEIFVSLTSANEKKSALDEQYRSLEADYGLVVEKLRRLVVQK